MYLGYPSNILSDKFCDEWVEKCGVSEDRIEIWKKRKEVEEKRQETEVVEERLLYYADFYDLKNCDGHDALVNCYFDG